MEAPTLLQRLEFGRWSQRLQSAGHPLCRHLAWTEPAVVRTLVGVPRRTGHRHLNARSSNLAATAPVATTAPQARDGRLYVVGHGVGISESP